jgi:hypothetical protein
MFVWQREKHIDDECPMKIIRCLLSSTCPFTAKRGSKQEWNAHVNENIVDHLLSVVNAFNQRQSDIEARILKIEARLFTLPLDSSFSSQFPAASSIQYPSFCSDTATSASNFNFSSGPSSSAFSFGTLLPAAPTFAANTNTSASTKASTSTLPQDSQITSQFTTLSVQEDQSLTMIDHQPQRILSSSSSTRSQSQPEFATVPPSSTSQTQGLFSFSSAAAQHNGNLHHLSMTVQN